MRVYTFAVHGEDATTTDETNTATLADDSSAWDYGESLIRDRLNSDPKAPESRVLVISNGNRIIASISFRIAALRVRRTLQ